MNFIKFELFFMNSIIKNNKMSFSWNDLVMIGMIKHLLDPELVWYFMEILGPRRRDFVEEESRDYHCSMRITKEERWDKLADRNHTGASHLTNASVPITFPLPFDGRMWRNSSKALGMIRYFREGFMMKANITRTHFVGVGDYVDQTFSEKQDTVNLIMNHGLDGINFRGGWSLKSIEEAYQDFIEYTTDNPTRYDDDGVAFILMYHRGELWAGRDDRDILEEGCHLKYMTIVN